MVDVWTFHLSGLLTSSRKKKLSNSSILSSIVDDKADLYIAFDATISSASPSKSEAATTGSSSSKSNNSPAPSSTDSTVSEPSVRKFCVSKRSVAHIFFFLHHPGSRSIAGVASREQVELEGPAEEV